MPSLMFQLSPWTHPHGSLALMKLRALAVCIPNRSLCGCTKSIARNNSHSKPRLGFLVLCTQGRRSTSGTAPAIRCRTMRPPALLRWLSCAATRGRRPLATSLRCASLSASRVCACIGHLLHCRADGHGSQRRHACILCHTHGMLHFFGDDSFPGGSAGDVIAKTHASAKGPLKCRTTHHVNDALWRRMAPYASLPPPRRPSNTQTKTALL